MALTNPFKPLDLPKPKLLTQIFGGYDHDTIVAEVNNILAGWNIEELQAEDIARIRSTYQEVSDRKWQDAATHIFKWYSNFRHQEGMYTPEENAFSARLAGALGIPIDKAARYDADMALPHFKQRFLERASQPGPEGVRAYMEEMYNKAGVDAGLILPQQNRWEEEHVQSLLTAAREDKKYSPGEEDQVSQAIQAFGLESLLTESLAGDLANLRENYQYDYGVLEPQNFGILLKPGELAYWMQDEVTLKELGTEVTYETTTVTRNMDVPFFKSMDWKVSTSETEVVTRTGVMQEKDTGELYMTNRRLFFKGSMGSLSLEYAEFVQVEQYTDGFRVTCDDGADKFFIFDSSNRSGDCILLMRLLHEAQASAR
jgi:hypothetical protein